MTFYTFMTQDWKKVHWIYGFEIDFDAIQRIDKQRAFFTSSNEYDGSFFEDECLSDATVEERVTDFLRQEFDCIAPMLGWDPDSPTKQKTYVLVVHANSTPQRSRDREKIRERVARLKTELIPEIKARPKWYFSCGAGVFKGDVEWEDRPRLISKYRH